MFTMTTCFSCGASNFQHAIRAVRSVVEFDGAAAFDLGFLMINEVSKLAVDWGSRVKDALKGELNVRTTTHCLFDSPWAKLAAAPSPVLTFVQKIGSELHGQALSLNLVLQHVSLLGTAYWVHWEESWWPRRPFLGRSLEIMRSSPSLAQVELVYNKYWGKWMHENNTWIVLNATHKMFACQDLEFFWYQKLWVKGAAKCYPLFSLHPSVNRAELVLAAGYFDNDPAKWPGKFEVEWACRLLHLGAQKAMLVDDTVVRQMNHTSAWARGAA